MGEQGFATIPRAILHDPDVPRDAKLVYLMLSSHVGGKASAWPSHRRMAELLGMSTSTVKRQLSWLRAKGHINWQARIGDNEARITNEYVLVAGSSSESTTVNRPSSVRAGGSVRATPSSDAATPTVSQDDPLVPTDLTEEESFNESQGTTTSTSVALVRQDVERLCGRLADRVEANGSLRPAITDKWRNAARLMLDKDGRTEEQISRAIDWCQTDDFWRANVLSMPTLREKYDRLRLAASRAGPSGNRQRETDQLFEQAAKRMGVI